ncbi:DUF2254 domain-containing protein [Nitratireductor basaltis]|uniref:DUF2254 domain-containing protein n=1 Tax=Nitratireductor basaltis TaxID=472175 RepID=A0A084UDU2_9HYPH|nr:DUF2254 domain-containing protein [Nitratireductor basaltis]KFB11128.1 hypothetical protein EL18_02172 [Nitratireductor basaltis]
MGTFWVLFNRVVRALWFLPAIFSVAALVVVSAAILVSSWFPFDVDTEKLPFTISADAVESILTIVASSMLAVAVFALSTLVALLNNVSQNATPRAVPLIVADRAAQTAISIFIGAFLFSVVGIIGLSAGIYSELGRIILFSSSIFVVLVVVWALLRWISEISRIGRIEETVERAENATWSALKRMGRAGQFGCKARRSIPAQATPLNCSEIGYLQHFDPVALQKVAEMKDLHIHLPIRPGSYVDHQTPLAWVEGDADEECMDELRSAFLVGSRRTFEYDPGFGLIVLSEIAQRALSPSLNDPKTAIHVATVQTRLLADWESRWEALAEADQHDRVSLVPVDDAEMLRAAFDGLVTDGVESREVVNVILRSLHTIQKIAPQRLAGPARQLAGEVLERCYDTLAHELDIEAVRETAIAYGFEQAQDAGSNATH